MTGFAHARGVEAVWSGGSWARWPAVVQAAPEMEVREAAESRKANLFYRCVVGLNAGVPPFFVGDKWVSGNAIMAAPGVGFFLGMVPSSVEHYLRTVRLSQTGLEERSFYGAWRIPWEVIGGLEFQDVREWFEDSNNAGSGAGAEVLDDAAHRRPGAEGPGSPGGLRLPAEMSPGDAFQKMREQIMKRTAGAEWPQRMAAR